jgi:hypothetical protein
MVLHYDAVKWWFYQLAFIRTLRFQVSGSARRCAAANLLIRMITSEDRSSSGLTVANLLRADQAGVAVSAVMISARRSMAILMARV